MSHSKAVRLHRPSAELISGEKLRELIFNLLSSSFLFVWRSVLFSSAIIILEFSISRKTKVKPTGDRVPTQQQLSSNDCLESMTQPRTLSLKKRKEPTFSYFAFILNYYSIKDRSAGKPSPSEFPPETDSPRNYSFSIFQSLGHLLSLLRQPPHCAPTRLPEDCERRQKKQIRTDIRSTFDQP